MLQTEKAVFENFDFYEKDWVAKANADPIMRWLKNTRNSSFHQSALAPSVDRLEEAEALMRKAIAIQERLDDKASKALYCWNLGRIYYARKQMGQAKEFFVKAVENYRAVGDTKMAQWIEAGLAKLDKPPEQASQAAE